MNEGKSGKKMKLERGRAKSCRIMQVTEENLQLESNPLGCHWTAFKQESDTTDL